VTVVSRAVSTGPTAQRYFIVGGAGFIGSHFCDRLLSPEELATLPGLAGR